LRLNKETAVEIGKSCKLLDENMEIIDLASSNEKDDTYEEFKHKLESEYNKKVFYNHRRFNQTEKKVLIIKPF